MNGEYLATVVSIVPFPIRERKIGIHPGNFEIPAYEEPLSTPINKMRPKVLHVGESIHFVYVGEDRPEISVPNSPIVIARSIVSDYIDSMLEVGDGAAPGIFALSGKLQSEEIPVKHLDELKVAKEKQINWFRRLIKLADDDWTRYHKHGVISDLQRKVAQLMGMDREWLSIVESEPPMICPICKSSIPNDAIVCPHCRVILNEEVYNMHKFAEMK